MLIFLRTSATVACLPSGPASAGRMSSRTTESLAPRICVTTSSMRQPSTSVNGPLSPWPTPTMRSPTFSLPDRPAGLPGTISRITVYSSRVCSTAPMPSSDRRMAMSKFSDARGPR